MGGDRGETVWKLKIRLLRQNGGTDVVAMGEHIKDPIRRQESDESEWAEDGIAQTRPDPTNCIARILRDGRTRRCGDGSTGRQQPPEPNLVVSVSRKL